MATATPIHPSWFAKAGTWLVNAARAVKNTIIKVAGASQGINAELQKVAPTVEALSNLVIPGSGTYEQHLLDVWGVAASAVHAAGDAAGGSGLNIQLDAALVAQIKAVLPAVQQFLHPNAGPSPAPGTPAAK